MDNRYFSSRSVELSRSEIHPAAYNPRTISEEGRKQLKRSIKRYGVVGGIVVNKATGFTIVGGHQKVAVLDELHKYDEKTHSGDYRLRVELIDVDEKTEKQLNIALNNPNIGGQWDYDALARIIPDIDYKDAGLTDADLSMIGVDYLLKTEQENDLAKEIEQLNTPIEQQREVQRQDKLLERAAREAHMKEVKQQVKDGAQKQAESMDSYVILSFGSFSAKAAFCERFGYDPAQKFIKGEAFDEQVERVE